MASQHDKSMRWRPRFSVRTLVIVVTLVSMYLGLWEITKQHGVREPSDAFGWSSREEPSVFDSRAIAPLVVIDREEATSQYMEENGIPQWGGPPMTQTSYYLWLFGPRICLSRAYD
jgi:hypothetical protein